MRGDYTEVVTLLDDLADMALAVLLIEAEGGMEALPAILILVEL